MSVIELSVTSELSRIVDMIVGVELGAADDCAASDVLLSDSVLEDGRPEVLVVVVDHGVTVVSWAPS